jgi:beta-galactosidase
MLLRDRNHPSIIMWSIGNEVIERDGHSGGAEIAHALADHVRALDPTRPVTAAINHSEPWERTDAVIASLDVCGYNYQLKHYAPDHDRVPDRVIYGSESMPPEAFEHWMSVLEMDHVIGDFVWTSLDYLGESGIGRAYLGDKEVFLGEYPWHQANCGDIDVCGFKQPQSYYRDILWQHGDPLYIAVHYPVPEGKTPIFSHWGWPDVWPNWTWPGREGQTFTVDVYSACEKVELFLNSKSLGVKPATREEKFIATFKVPYEPGELKAVGIRGGAQVAESSVLTVGAPAAIRLTPDRSTLRPEQVDLSFVTVEIVDAQGRVHPDADDQVAFSVGGAGSLAAVGSSNPVSTEPYRGDRRRAFRGRCLIVVKSEGEPGEIRLRARADGLDGAEVVIRVG